MKKTFYIAAIVIYLSASTNAQVMIIPERRNYNQFDWEVTNSFSLGMSKTSIDRGSSNEAGYYYNDPGENTFYSESALAIGFFIFDGLSVEPEIDFNFLTDEASVSIIGNLCYTLSIPRKNIYPYFKIGYGISGFESNNYYYYDSDTGGLFESLESGVLSSSIGLKIVNSSTNAFRLELNYKRFNNSVSFFDTFYQSTQQYDISTDAISIVFGYSFLF